VTILAGSVHCSAPVACEFAINGTIPPTFFHAIPFCPDIFRGKFVNIGSWLLTVSLLFSTSVIANTFTGSPKVIDGDTIVVQSQVIRLYGIDAPENGQKCKNARGKSYSCGKEAEKALKALVESGVSCTGSEFDNYDSLIAVCSNGSADINRQMVLAGHALVFRKFSDTYIDEESAAERSRAGIWQGQFEPPWEFRSKRWAVASQESPYPDCPIKGNINRKGVKIYHTPWSRSYGRTKIDESKKERWFCSEAEALAAGWRAPLR
jgi:endonuclease YncB( thermonuclease family)